MKKNIYFWVSVLLAGSMMSGCTGKKKEPTIDATDRVTAMKVVEASSQDGNSYAGTVEGTNAVALSFSAAGTIRSLNINEGQAVRAGQRIGSVDATTSSNALMVAQAGTRQAADAYKQALDAYKRMKQLHDSKALPDIQWVDAQTKLNQAQSMVRQAQASEAIARKGVTDTRLLAPCSGYIADKTGEVGENVMPGVPVAKLVSIDRVKIKVSVPEEDISLIRTGQAVRLSVGSLGNASFYGNVTEKGVSADPIAHTYDVMVLVGNAQHRLLPGMVCDVFFVQNSNQRMMLPANLIQIDDENRPFVWTVMGRKAHKQLIVTGESVGDNILIVSGLSMNTLVICKGQQKVSEGMRVSLQ